MKENESFDDQLRTMRLRTNPGSGPVAEQSLITGPRADFDRVCEMVSLEDDEKYAHNVLQAWESLAERAPVFYRNMVAKLEKSHGKLRVYAVPSDTGVLKRPNQTKSWFSRDHDV